MSGGWFVTGTDTGVGKTYCACQLLHALRAAGHRAVGMKPIAAGCRQTARGGRSQDAERLIAASAARPRYADVNPYALPEAVAPHLAARAAGVALGVSTVIKGFERLQRLAPWVVVEGVGGWLVPLDERRTMADVAKALGLPVVLVVGMRLGCLNHALLTEAAVRASGLRLAGWVANEADPPMDRLEENIATLRSRLSAPLLARCPRQAPGKLVPVPFALAPLFAECAETPRPSPGR